MFKNHSYLLVIAVLFFAKAVEAANKPPPPPDSELDYNEFHFETDDQGQCKFTKQMTCPAKLAPVAPPTKVDCADWLSSGSTVTKTYEIEFLKPDGSPTKFNVSCDMDPSHSGGGWTQIQQNFGTNNTAVFQGNFAAYEAGTGTPAGNQWLGLEKMHWMSENQNDLELRVDYEDCNNVTKFIEYDLFQVGNSASQYELTLGAKSAGDALDAFHGNGNPSFDINGQKFYTQDNDSDSAPCSQIANNAGFWYVPGSCGLYSVNGKAGSICGDANHELKWVAGTNLKKVSMKVRSASKK